MSELLKKLLISSLIVSTVMNICNAGLWDDVKNVASKAGDAVVDTATKVGDTVSDAVSEDTPIQQRAEIDSNAQKTLSRLLNESKEANEFYEKAAGYAVFDSREFAFLIKTGFGSGVAVNKMNNERIYMKMASAGANIGGGIKYLQVIFIFPTEASLNKFINDGWSADADASAVGGDESSQAGVTLADGTKIYQLVDTGIMLKASIGGTKYWKDSDLN
jgi:lipid-binding SYLF domain-containing protein